MTQFAEENRALYRLAKAQHRVGSEALLWRGEFSTQAKIVCRWDIWEKRVPAGTNFGWPRQSRSDAVVSDHLLQGSFELH